MRRAILTTITALGLTGGAYFLGSACLVGTTWGASQTDETPHRVGLIDLGHILQNYEKLKMLQADLQAEAQAKKDDFDAMAKKIKDKQAELKALTEGSPDYAACDQKLTTMMSDYETKTKVANRQFQQKQAKMLQTVYLEVQDAVERFCDKYKFTVVIRFSRTDANSSDPAKVNQLMSQTVMYHRNKDDLTEGVLKYLNEKYLSTADKEARPVTKTPKKDRNLQGAGAKD